MLTTVQARKKLAMTIFLQQIFSYHKKHDLKNLIRGSDMILDGAKKVYFDLFRQ